MNRLRTIAPAAALAATLALGACGPGRYGPPPPTPAEVTALARTIRALGPEVDPGEAERAALIAHTHAWQLAQEYRVSDPPLVHNSKVNMGLRERGLCFHWAEDMEARLAAEDFRTLELHRAISPGARMFRIDHSTVILGRRGEPLQEGVVLDPWRKGGDLFWSPVADDPRYKWRPRNEVLAEKAARLSGTTSARNSR
ncbi:hypothetical protein [Rhodovulum euryhalinum]|uniref:Lipoprotein n=1 Tax=Rhodovulum euryhalinum TaxID=35805 RepID=A0A4R2KVG5_9RHOB|nr:hypothetical protein [Rhodovulum euryhalinum]TCO74218.1 hypothetical protein EV655_101379 [Rhodovulum euryhalinum]